MRHVLKALSAGGLKLLKMSRFLRGSSIAGIFIVFTFFYNLFTKGLSFAFASLAKQVLAAELVINENVHLAIINSSEYTIFAFLDIMVSLLILFTLAKFITKTLVGFTGSQAVWGAAIFSIIIIGIIEMAAVAVLEGTFGFIPIKDGVIFLLWNLGPVLGNIFSEGVKTVIEEKTNISLNTSINMTGKL